MLFRSCGKKPPQVILHVDHIVAVANGGTNNRENLATSCSDCNFGKSSIPLGQVTESLSERLKREVEIAKQMRQYNKWLEKLNAEREVDFLKVSDAIILAEGDNPNEFVISGSRASTVRLLLKRMPRQSIVEAVSIADSKFSFKSNPHRAFKYFCGVCWRTIDKAEGVVR